MRQQPGFTLLELLVVISIIGLIAGIIAPRFVDMSDRLTLKNEEFEVRQKINGLPLLALRKGIALYIDTKGAPFNLPTDWKVVSDAPIVYQSNGACLGGQIEVWHGKTLRQTITLLPPFCQWPS